MSGAALLAMISLWPQAYNTRVVLVGVTLLGVTSAIIGTFLFLRKRALIGDVAGHSALPGIAIAFLVVESIRPGEGKNVPALLAGAAIAGLFGAQFVALVERFTRVQNDAAQAVVLSVFYGAGVALLSIIQRVSTGSSAGLKDYLGGKTAALMANDVWLFAGIGGVILTLTVLFFKELTLLCFDDDYAATAGLPVRWLDGVLTFLATTVSVIGMQTVGLLLVTAILVIPPASARFWTNNVRRLALISAFIGGASSAIGVLLSASHPRLAAGPMIVLVGGAVFILSLTFGTRRGVVWGLLKDRHSSLKADRLDLLRAIYETLERDGPTRRSTMGDNIYAVISSRQLEPYRTWPAERLERTLKRAVAENLLTVIGPGEFGLTDAAWAEAQRVARNHRLWELYLIHHADVAPASVDRNADRIEHILGPELIRELELVLARETPAIPRSPHQTTLTHS